MSVTFRPAKRVNTPLVVGLAGPTKSGKTMSAHRLAVGMAQGAPVVMLNTEGARGHQYADRFAYVAADLAAPFRPQQYSEALAAAIALKPRPGVVIVDSCSHMHDGPGGILEWHESELDRLAGDDRRKRDRNNFTAWIRPKAAENEFINAMLVADCHLILCFRAKEKLRIVPGKDPVNLGWQPIAGDRVTFETIFTLMFEPHSKGAPNLALSEMREPFDRMISGGRQLDEETGVALAAWAAGGASMQDRATSEPEREPPTDAEIAGLTDELLELTPAAKGAVSEHEQLHDAAAHRAWLERQITRVRDAREMSPQGTLA